MSKELLKALVDVLDDLKLRKNLSEDDALNISDSVLVRAEKAIENYLTQPEQEPVAWCQLVDGKVQDLLTSFEMKDWIKDDSWIPLYTSPPKREPLSEGEIFNIGYKAGLAIDHVESDDGESTDYGFIDGDGYIDNDLVFKFVRWIEKAHGIGE